MVFHYGSWEQALYGSWEQALFPALGEYGALSPTVLSDGPIPSLGQLHPTHVLISLVLNS